jgi:hypothetical protein
MITSATSTGNFSKILRRLPTLLLPQSSVNVGSNGFSLREGLLSGQRQRDRYLAYLGHSALAGIYDHGSAWQCGTIHLVSGIGHRLDEREIIPIASPIRTLKHTTLRQ